MFFGYNHASYNHASSAGPALGDGVTLGPLVPWQAGKACGPPQCYI